MKKPHMMADSGSPVAKPSFCVYIVFLNVKLVDVAINCKSCVMSRVVRLVRLLSVLSIWSRSCAIFLILACTGVLVKSDMTSCEMNNFSRFTLRFLSSFASSFNFFAVLI